MYNSGLLVSDSKFTKLHVTQKNYFTYKLGYGVIRKSDHVSFNCGF